MTFASVRLATNGHIGEIKAQADQTDSAVGGM